MRSACALVTTCLLGCSHHVYSPPARTLPLESMASVGRARTALALEGARHSINVPFGYGASSGTARFRHGVAENVDLSLEGHIIHIDGDPAADVDQNIYALRIGTKYMVNSAFALTGGWGMGLHEGGSYASPDLGLLAGWENRYAVPFFSARGLLSVPIRAHEVDTTNAGTPLGTDVGTPVTTVGFGTTAGLRVPIPPSFEPHVGVRGSLLGGVGTIFLGDNEDSAAVVSAGGGAEIEF